MDIPLLQTLSDHYLIKGMNGYVDAQKRVTTLTGSDGLLSRLERGDYVFLRNDSGWFDLIKPNVWTIRLQEDDKDRRKKMLTLDAITFPQVDNPKSYVTTKEGPKYLGAPDSSIIRGIKGLVAYTIATEDLPRVRIQNRF